MKTLEERAEHQIELIEQDESMTEEEKRIEIKDIYEQLKEYERERIEDNEHE